MEKYYGIDFSITKGQKKVTLEIEDVQYLIELFKQGYELMLVKPEVRKPISVNIDIKEKG